MSSLVSGDESGTLTRRALLQSVGAGVWMTAREPRGGRAPLQDGAALVTQAPGGTAPARRDQANYPLSSNEKGGMEESGPYEVVPDHFKGPHPPGWTWGAVEGIHIESPDRIYVCSTGMLPELKHYTTRAGSPVRDATLANDSDTALGRSLRKEHVLTVFDGKGNAIEQWKHLDPTNRSSHLHRIRVDPRDPEKHLWLVDTGLGRILKVARSGQVVMTVGVTNGRDPNATSEDLKSPKDLAFLPNSDFLVLEDARVVKFSKDGKRLMAFGKQGMAPGELNRAHAMAIDSRGRIYVGERPRIQVFDQTGKTLDIWPNIRFGSGFIALDSTDHLWVADAEIHRIAKFDLNGKLLYHWGVQGVEPGQLYGVSHMAVDGHGTLYVTEHYGGRIQMFRPRKGANPNHVIAQLLG